MLSEMFYLYFIFYILVKHYVWLIGFAKSGGDFKSPPDLNRSVVA